jgi:two-component system chemotaxis sensor kinase CheA
MRPHRARHVRRLEQGVLPRRPMPACHDALRAALAGELDEVASAPADGRRSATSRTARPSLHQASTGVVPVAVPGGAGRRRRGSANDSAAPKPGGGVRRHRPARHRQARAQRHRPAGATARRARQFDPRRYVAPRPGAQPVGRNRPDQEPPERLRADILAGKNDTETLHALDAAVSQLDLLVSDLQNAVMKTRMQPIGRLFQKYPRIARDLARNLGKDVELVLVGEETEIDKTMIEDLSDPIIHLIRNAVDHGVEVAAGRASPPASRRSRWCASKRARKATTSSSRGRRRARHERRAPACQGARRRA